MSITVDGVYELPNDPGVVVKLGEAAFGVKPNVPADCEDVSVGAYALPVPAAPAPPAAVPAPLVAPAPTAWVVLAAAGGPADGAGDGQGARRAAAGGGAHIDRGKSDSGQT